ncbi:hypothetical protein TUM20985_01710 [Mycobacterium antarcticum]|uniref:DUF4129 domain-containing protein n=1 Tax=unclassified Mycolicibacterium TaxID=2636767 RepID=UPI002384240D|nr:MULTISPECIES: DUF4129 domain-containing protein [unclassified Mycolicibacterium]BDX29624.1 hypothetical protein TUM20985_01710 [Mycolicibacterium sp. TUM20985]GLP73055.1 hypothetical protein TUM20983_01650 [Mycolicibacterium sp. TUM20983]GLP78770.1 hypothetical protein TUM20984_01900 [Mycolicibacterium sp. TUM20984]
MTVLVALLFMAAAALRGYVPGAEPAPREPAGDDPVALVVVMVLLVAAVAVVAVAVITRLRHRGEAPPRVTARPDWLRGDRGRPTWRIAIIAFALLLGWLLLSVLLGQLGGGTAGDADTPGATPDAADAPDASGSPSTLPTEPDGGSDLLGYFYGATVIFLVVIVVGSIIAARRRPPPAGSNPLAPHDPTSDPADGSESLARAAEVGLAEVGDLTREPRKAIIACYAAMERQLSLLPDAAPRDFDTASEVLARAVEHHALAPDSATQLVDLFEEARFSRHVMNEGHRDAAVAVLTHVLDELRSHA